MKKNMVALPLASSAMGYASHTRFTLPEGSEDMPQAAAPPADGRWK
jgi:hypothetical protein